MFASSREMPSWHIFAIKLLIFKDESGPVAFAKVDMRSKAAELELPFTTATYAWDNLWPVICSVHFS